MNNYIIKATAANHQIRAYAAVTKEMVEEARRIHNTSPVATAALGRTLTAGAIMGSMMKNEKDVLTIQIKGDGPIGGITVTADSKANVKGYVNNPNVVIPANKIGKLDVAGANGKGMLTIIKDIGLKEPYVGHTPLVSGEIAEDITYYFASSEQVPSVVALGVLMNKDNTVRQAGGFIIQLLPGASEEVITKLENTIKGINSVTTMFEEGNTPETILENILGNVGLEQLDKIPTDFKCNCTREKVEKALISIGKRDLQEIADEGEPVELNCHFCNESYVFEVEDIKKYI